MYKTDGDQTIRRDEGKLGEEERRAPFVQRLEMDKVVSKTKTKAGCRWMLHIDWCCAMIVFVEEMWLRGTRKALTKYFKVGAC